MRREQRRFKGIEKSRRATGVAVEEAGERISSKSPSLTQTVAVLNRNHWLYLYHENETGHAEER